MTVLEVHDLSPPSGKSDYVFARWNGGLIAIGGIHPPAEILTVGRGEERRVLPPLPSAESPRGPQQVHRQPGIDQRSRDQPQHELRPGPPLAIDSRILRHAAEYRFEVPLY